MSKSDRRRARRIKLVIEDIDRMTLWASHGGVCGLCRGLVTLEEMTIDHVVPLAKGGLHSYANTQPAHSDCNQDKGDDLPDDYITPRRKQRRQVYYNRPFTCR
jgi:5-methylcytosine-specific restriction endonuclease McrA